MAFVAINQIFGEVDLTSIDPAGPGYPNLVTGTGSGRMNFYAEVVPAYDGSINAGGEFVYLQYSGTIVQGTVCSITPSLVNGRVVMTATPWAGTSNTGTPLCVAYAATGSVGQWGWFQVGGPAITTVQGAPAAGNPVYWQASGVVSPTAVAGKQVLNAEFASAVSQALGTGSSAQVLSATQALVLLNRPFGQGAIT